MQFILSLSRIWQFYSINFRICGIVELWGISTKLRYLLKVSSDYSIVYGEIIFLNDNQYFYAYLYGENAHFDINAPPPLQNHYTNFFSNFYILFFYFRRIVLQISHKKMFFYKYFYTRAFRDIERCITAYGRRITICFFYKSCCHWINLKF